MPYIVRSSVDALRRSPARREPRSPYGTTNPWWVRLELRVRTPEFGVGSLTDA